MKLFKTLLTILFISLLLIILAISLLFSPSRSVTKYDLVEREGIFYEKVNDVPFTGKITGHEQGSFKNGKKEGIWVWSIASGQLSGKKNYKDGKKEGAWVSFLNGQLATKGYYKNGKKEGFWINYNENGTVNKEFTGTFKDGKKISD